MGLRLMFVTGVGVNYDGTAEIWKYEYTNPAGSAWPIPTYWFHADSGGGAFDSVSTLRASIVVITQKWFNSDSALVIAESNGGSDFRNANPNYSIEASLDEPLVRAPTTYWRVTYRSEDDPSKYLSLSIDANSGQIVLDHVFAPAPNTAAYRLASVDSLAETYANGLLLTSVRSDGLKYDGRAEKWIYLYVNPAGIPRDNSMYWFHADSVGVSLDSTSAVYIGSAVIYAAWFNSDSALSIAEQNGGSHFRSENPNYTIQAAVGGCDCPYIETDWWITYRSRDDKSKFFSLTIDATTSAVVYKSE